MSPRDQFQRVGAGYLGRWRRLNRPAQLFSVCVLLPALAVLLYCLVWASPMYISEARFAIRGATPTASNELSSLFKSPLLAALDAYIITEYIYSADLVDDLDRDLGLTRHFSSRTHDFFFRLHSSPTQDERLRYWKKVVHPALDADTGIVFLKVKAFSPEMAQRITQAILERSEALVNAMNQRAQEDAISLAREEVSRSEARVKAAQEALRAFRDEHTLLDPKAAASGVQTLLSNLEGEIVKLRAQLSEARSFMREDAPAAKALRVRLSALEKQLAQERQRLAGIRSQEGNLNSVVGEYEDLSLEAEFAQKQLVAAMSSLEAARVQAVAKSRYVVAFQNPVVPDESLYPRPFLFAAYVFFGALLLLGLLSLIIAAIREHAGF